MESTSKTGLSKELLVTGSKAQTHTPDHNHDQHHVDLHGKDIVQSSASHPIMLWSLVYSQETSECIVLGLDFISTPIPCPSTIWWTSSHEKKLERTNIPITVMSSREGRVCSVIAWEDSKGACLSICVCSNIRSHWGLEEQSPRLIPDCARSAS